MTVGSHSGKAPPQKSRSVNMPFIFRFPSDPVFVPSQQEGSSFRSATRAGLIAKANLGVGRALKRVVRKVVYHLGGKPLLGLPMVGLTFRGDTAQTNRPAEWHGPRLTRKCRFARIVAGAIGKTWKGKTHYEDEYLWPVDRNLSCGSRRL